MFVVANLARTGVTNQKRANMIVTLIATMISAIQTNISSNSDLLYNVL